MTTTTTTNHAFFMLVHATTDWLALAPADRFAFVDKVMRPILKRHPDVSLRYFDSEAFHGRFSDVLLWETASILSYQEVVEELRETKFWDHYFEVRDVVPSIENAYAIHYDVAPV